MQGLTFGELPHIGTGVLGGSGCLQEIQRTSSLGGTIRSLHNMLSLN